MSMITVGNDLTNSDVTFATRQRDIEVEEKKEAEARERAKKSPFSKFAQINLDDKACDARIQLIKQSPIAAQIWEFLLKHADRYNAVVCSVKVFEEALGYTKQSITKALKVLRDMKFVDVKKSGVTNVYLLNKTLVWKSWGTNYKYAKFAATVIISEREQEKPVITTKVTTVSLKEDSQQRGKDSQQTEEDEEYNESCISEENECPPDDE